MDINREIIEKMIGYKVREYEVIPVPGTNNISIKVVPEVGVKFIDITFNVDKDGPKFLD